MFAEAVRRGESELRDIQRGLEVVASDALRPTAPAARRRYAPLAAAAIGIAIIGGAIVATRGENKEPVARGTTPPIINPVPGPQLTLQQKVAGADMIVVGTVTQVRTGTLGAEAEGGMEYAMATIRVEERIKGSPGDSVVAFDYVYGVVSPEVPGGQWAHPGDRLLVFLVSDEGAVSEDLRPAHLQIAEGFAGRFAVKDGGLIGAPFTLQDVRDEAGR